MAVALKQLVKFTSSTSAATSTFVTTADILPGEDIFIVTGRAIQSTNLCGILSISTSAGAGTFSRIDTACRLNTFDVNMGRFRCTTLIPAGSTITATYRSSTAKRGAIMQVVSGLTSAAAQSDSGNLADNQLGDTNRGPNGSSTAAIATIGAPTTVPDTLVIGAFGEGGTNAFAGTSGTTMVDEARTVTGTADRGVGLFYKIANTTGVKSLNASVSPSGSWAGVIGAFEIDTTAPPTSAPEFREWDGADWQTLTPKEWDGDSWNVLDPAEL
jgi:hypothetical protein